MACLGVTDGDWRALAMSALEGLQFNIAKLVRAGVDCFIRTIDL